MIHPWFTTTPSVDAPTVAFLEPVREVAPAISVCIAVRDRPALLVKSIRSVLAGSFDDFEVVVVDDGSSVPAQDCLAEAGLLADERIRLVRQKPSGISAARNTALRIARGRWITVLDSDDELTEDGLARIREFLATTGASWIYTDYEEIVGGTTRPIRLPSYETPGRMLRSVLIRPRLPFKHSGMSIDRQLLVTLGGYDDQLFIKVDVELVLRALTAGIRLEHLPHPVVRFHRHDGSISRQRFAGLGVWFQLINEYRRPRLPGLALGFKTVRAASEIGKWLVASLGR
ncbi:glycosyltransferase [Micromonospora peucetia]|uniref:Glycosyltransferase n=1 Tax=Micromonospora peucetia TaxID=47871 RepID=A0A1C6UAU1_9ACTN|nr:glycosyltransferase [Micromonospora peucetia]MCX4386388.1 glycosyltransferase [Micromonospora peucetia]WSA33729.1 glycosyltransferase [Micromonospora peucetia]SCL51074.1 Glycosyltransferase involved in cell wall bisynthesis [Micromonospora peucetia]